VKQFHGTSLADGASVTLGRIEFAERARADGPPFAAPTSFALGTAIGVHKAASAHGDVRARPPRDAAVTDRYPTLAYQGALKNLRAEYGDGLTAPTGARVHVQVFDRS